MNTLRKKTFSTEKTLSIVLCSSAAAAVAIGQLQLQLSHHSSVALRLFASRNVTSEGASKKFSRLAIARQIFRPPHKLCYNSSDVTKALDAETEAKTEAVYLDTEAEAQGSWTILFAVRSSVTTSKYTCL